MVTHSPSWIDPVPLGTRVPCKRIREGGQSSRTLDADWARRFAACLQLDSLADPGERGCEGDSVRVDQVQFKFRQGSQTVDVDVNLGRGDLGLSDSRQILVPRILGVRTPGLRALLAEALPGDSLLAGAMVCDGSQSTPTNRTSDDGPAYGAAVYVEKLPEAVRRVPPAYPDQAVQGRVSGQVMVQALVGKDGRVHRMLIRDSIPLLDGPAAAAVEQWEFKPARNNGEPVAVWVAIPVRFSLH